MRWEELDGIQQVGVLQALYKVIAKDVSTRDPDSLRSRVDADVIGRYEATGAKSYDIRYGGEKVGTYSVTVKKATTSTVFDLVDDDAFGAWLSSDEGTAAIDAFVSDHVEEFVRYVVEQTGEIPDGVEPREVVTPERVSGTTIRIDPKKVAGALGNSLSPAIAGLLGGA